MSGATERIAVGTFGLLQRLPSSQSGLIGDFGSWPAATDGTCTSEPNILREGVGSKAVLWSPSLCTPKKHIVMATVHTRAAAGAILNP